MNAQYRRGVFYPEQSKIPKVGTHAVFILSNINLVHCVDYQVQQCFLNKVQPSHFSANVGHHLKARDIPKEIPQVYYMHVLSCKG